MDLPRTGWVMAAAVLSASGARAAEPQMTTADTAAIRAIVEPFERPPGFFDAVDWENAFGGRRKGAAELTKFLTERVRPTMTRMKLTVKEVRLTPVTPDVVMADNYQTLSGQTDVPGGKVLPDRNVRHTFVLRRSSGRWEIVAERIADLRR